MKSCRIWIVFVLPLVLWGCSSPGILISRQETDVTPVMGTTPDDGTYGLFVAGKQDDLLEFPLKKDQAIGFRFDEQGAVRWLYAVAGDEHVPLDITKTYEWRRQP